MKTITKLALLSATVAAFGTNAAFADDQQLQYRLDMQRAQDSQRGQRDTTVAVYSNQRGIGRSTAIQQSERSASRFELRSNAHGESFGVFVPAN